MLTPESAAADLLRRMNRFTEAQACHLRVLLEEVTIAELLGYQTAQELADLIEKKAREYFKVIEPTWPKREQITEDEYLVNGAPITLGEMGDVAYKLLVYAHQMFDSIGNSVRYACIHH